MSLHQTPADFSFDLAMRIARLDDQQLTGLESVLSMLEQGARVDLDKAAGGLAIVSYGLQPDQVRAWRGGTVVITMKPRSSL